MIPPPFSLDLTDVASTPLTFQRTENEGFRDKRKYKSGAQGNSARHLRAGRDGRHANPGLGPRNQ